MYTIPKHKMDSLVAMANPCLVLADMHVKKRTWNNWTNLCGDAYRAIQNIRCINRDINQARTAAGKNKIPYCIFAGDIFDSATSSSADVYAVSSLTSDFDTAMYIAGNHDANRISYMDSLHNTLNLAKSVVSADDYNIVGIAYTSDREQLLNDLDSIKESLPSAVEKPLFLVLHEGFEHLIGIEGAWQINAHDIAERFGNYVRVICGHVHKNNDLHFHMNTPGYIYSPGSIYKTDWQAPDECYATYIDLSTGEKTLIPYTLRDFRILDDSEEGVNIIDEIRAISEAFNESDDPCSLLKPAVKIVTEHPESVIKKEDIPDNVLVWISIKSKESEAARVQAQEGGTTTFLACMLADITDNNQTAYEDLCTLAENIYNSDDPVSCIANYLQEAHVLMKVPVKKEK